MHIDLGTNALIVNRSNMSQNLRHSHDSKELYQIAGTFKKLMDLKNLK